MNQHERVARVRILEGDMLVHDNNIYIRTQAKRTLFGQATIPFCLWVYYKGEAPSQRVEFVDPEAEELYAENNLQLVRPALAGRPITRNRDKPRAQERAQFVRNAHRHISPDHIEEATVTFDMTTAAVRRCQLQTMLDVATHHRASKDEPMLYNRLEKCGFWVDIDHPGYAAFCDDGNDFEEDQMIASWFVDLWFDENGEQRDPAWTIEDGTGAIVKGEV